MPGRSSRLVGLVVGAAVALLLLRASTSRRESIDESTGLPDVDLVNAEPEQPSAPDDLANAVPAYVSPDPVNNLDAFLYALRLSEHNRDDVLTGADWTTFYGGGRFTDLSDHPVLTGERTGVPLPSAWCVRLGYADGHCVSTAAGALQINVPTWREVRSWGGPTLPDFSPDSQLEAGRRILRKIGAASYIEQGDLAHGLALASSRWASLPGSKAGQGRRSVDFVMAAFDEGLSAQGMA